MKIKFFIVTWTVAFCTLVYSEEASEHHLQKSTVEPTKYFDANRIVCSVRNDGVFARHPISGNSDFKFDDDYLICTSGLWLAAKVNGYVRASAADFNTDWVGSAIDEFGIPFGKEDSTFRVYKISRGDNAATNPDYAQWPSHLGAPTDAQGNPLILGDQTLWCSFTDSYLEDRDSQCLPLGAEVHLTVWGWKDIDNVMFLRWEIFNKSQDVWEDAYFGIYSDPDVGDASNDLVASDSTLKIVYCYDANNWYTYFPFYALGYQILESPVVNSPGDTAITFWGDKSNYKNVPVYSPRMEKNMGVPDGWWNDIGYDQFGAQNIYKRLRCLNMQDEPAIDPITGQPSKWIYSGDPVTGSGWIENIQPRDRRMMVSTGPITVVPGDTNFITMAIIATGHKDRLSNIIDLKKDAHFIRDAFQQQFKTRAKAVVEIESLASLYKNIYVRADVYSESIVSAVQVKFFNYMDEFIHSIELFDDGTHCDEIADDGIYGNNWQTSESEAPLYLNLEIEDHISNRTLFQHAEDYITLSNKVQFHAQIVADHINYDGKANPGENLRLAFEITNNYSFDLGKIGLSLTDIDTFIAFQPISFHLDSIPTGGSNKTNYIPSDRNSYLTFNIPAAIPDTHQIKLQLSAYEEDCYHWTETLYIPIFPFEYVPDEIVPTRISGKSDASFVVRIFDPNQLTGHSYLLAVSDSINDKMEKGFHLIDQTLSDSLLINSPTPDKYAYNVPVTDGFKVIAAKLPEGGLQNVFYNNVAGGHVTGFEGVNFGGNYFSGGVELGLAKESDYFYVELEFTNNIDATGVIGDPNGQYAFRYEYSSNTNPTDFLPCPFNVWKVHNGQRIGRLNACFYENTYFPTYDNTWAPDTSLYGGFELLYIMKTDYDPNGQFYMEKKLDLHEVLYKVHLRLKSASGIVDTGDKLIFEWEYPATKNDKFIFFPTGIFKKPKLEIAESFRLYQNYPNPFNPTTTIRFSIAKQSQVNLKIYNILGQEVADLFNRVAAPGDYAVNWNGKDRFGRSVVSGIYFARVETSARTKLIKMVLIR